ncbi:hypothetical protein [Azonexus sp. IMCC34839]|uniref:Ppx/GppA phosphatase family protein n=1 Tax=Azonexus sp. IMCC34839 TaxID=3133695 RepID=UPI00399B16CB
MFQRLCRHLAGLLLIGLAAAAGADPACRIAYDIGSSGIRAGTTLSEATARANIDYLEPLWAGRGLEETVAPTVKALRDFPESNALPADCPRVGGGFSAWRLALEKDAEQTAAILARLRAESGVAVFVVPQLREGAYGYLGSQKQLGERLNSTHVLDIGGGSMQVAGEKTAYGAMLGQKAWLRLLCQEIRNAESTPCNLQPLTGDELETARKLIQEQLAGIATELPVGRMSLTAVSRPVTLGVYPAIEKLYPNEAAQRSIPLPTLSQSIDHLARLTMGETVAQTGAPHAPAAYLLSTMLLVEGIMQATATPSLAVAEVDLTNIPGLLADDRAFAWERRYGCYLDRLKDEGLTAFYSDPATCP